MLYCFFFICVNSNLVRKQSKRLNKTKEMIGIWKKQQRKTTLNELQLLSWVEVNKLNRFWNRYYGKVIYILLLFLNKKNCLKIFFERIFVKEILFKIQKALTWLFWYICIVKFQTFAYRLKNYRFDIEFESNNSIILSLSHITAELS